MLPAGRPAEALKPGAHHHRAAGEALDEVRRHPARLPAVCILHVEQRAGGEQAHPQPVGEAGRGLGRHPQAVGQLAEQGSGRGGRALGVKDDPVDAAGEAVRVEEREAVGEVGLADPRHPDHRHRPHRRPQQGRRQLRQLGLPADNSVAAAGLASTTGAGNETGSARPGLPSACSSSASSSRACWIC